MTKFSFKNITLFLIVYSFLISGCYATHSKPVFCHYDGIKKLVTCYYE